MNAPRGLLVLLALIGTGLMIYYLNRTIFGETPEGSVTRALVWTLIVAAYVLFTLSRQRPS